MRLNSAAADAVVFPVAAPLIDVPVTQAVVAVTTKIETIKLMTILTKRMRVM